MAVFLLKIVFLGLNTLTNLVSRFIFTWVAYFLVLVIQGLRVPGQAINGMLANTGDLVKSLFEYILELLMEAISSLISTGFDYLKEAVFGSFGLISTGVGDLVSKTKDSLDGLMKDFPEIFEGLSEMVLTMIKDLWNNYKDAIGYFTENA